MNNSDFYQEEGRHVAFLISRMNKETKKTKTAAVPPTLRPPDEMLSHWFLPVFEGGKKGQTGLMTPP